MNSLLIRTNQYAKEEYNSIPVHYCANCLSLSVRRVAGLDDASYCDKCGGTDILEANIKDWEELHKNKYGFNYLENEY